VPGRPRSRRVPSVAGADDRPPRCAPGFRVGLQELPQSPWVRLSQGAALRWRRRSPCPPSFGRWARHARFRGADRRSQGRAERGRARGSEWSYGHHKCHKLQLLEVTRGLHAEGFFGDCRLALVRTPEVVVRSVRIAPRRYTQGVHRDEVQTILRVGAFVLRSARSASCASALARRRMPPHSGGCGGPVTLWSIQGDSRAGHLCSAHRADAAERVSNASGKIGPSRSTSPRVEMFRRRLAASVALGGLGRASPCQSRHKRNPLAGRNAVHRDAPCCTVHQSNVHVTDAAPLHSSCP